MGFLLDINVLIARTDRAHPFHDKAVAWMIGVGSTTIATCPITENGFLRIYGHPNYAGGPGSAEAARKELAVIRLLPSYQFVPDSITLDDAALFPSLEGVKSRHLTDLYLVGLAARHGLKFATFDAAIPAQLAAGGAQVLEIIPG